MKDQVRAMIISAVYTGSTCIDDSTEADIIDGKYQLVFFSPEALLCEERWFGMMPTRLLEYLWVIIAFLARDYSNNYIPACHGMLALVNRRNIPYITSWHEGLTFYLVM